MEFEIYELYVLHLIKDTILGSWQSENIYKHFQIACELLLQLESHILEELINKLDDKNLFR